MEKPFLIVFGDSLSLPRPFDSDSPSSFLETWPYLLTLKSSLEGVSNFSRGGFTSSDILKLAIQMSPYIKNNENIIIIYVGVVDSTPRPYPKILKRFFNLISKILMILKSNWRHYRSPLLLKIYGRPWISAKKYATNIENIIKLFSENKVIVILLNEPGKKLTNIVGNFSVNEYNDKLKKIFSKNLFLVKVSNHLHPDGHHLSRLGHEVISEEIAKLLKTSVIT